MITYPYPYLYIRIDVSDTFIITLFEKKNFVASSSKGAEKANYCEIGVPKVMMLSGDNI
jgi:hypothetical protein